MQRAAAVRVVMSVAVLCGMAAMGCSAGGTTGSSEALVEQVDRATLESQLLYYDPVVSARPLTAEQLGDTTGAVPVRVEILDTVAVAWLAPNGVARFDRGSIVAVYPLVTPTDDGFTDITPITDTTHATTVPRATSPSGGIGGTGGLTGSGPGVSGGPEIALPGLTAGLTATFLKWQQLISQNPNLSHEIGSYHPGCG